MKYELIIMFIIVIISFLYFIIKLKLQKRDRLNIYKKMREIIINHEKQQPDGYIKRCLGYCTYLKHIVNTGYVETINDLYELLAYKPKNIKGGFWFSIYDFRTRINILDEIINKLEK